MNDEQAPPMARPRVAAGALFADEHGNSLLVKPTYKDGWDIPGGYVEPGETPREACRREVNEELGLDRPVNRLLVVDWAPSEAEGDKVLFVFDGGLLTSADYARITLQVEELSEITFFDEDQLSRFLNQRLNRRISQARQAQASDSTLYLEHGVP